ncbi:MAG: YCF48-related protein [Ignavibacteria bacterium]
MKKLIFLLTAVLLVTAQLYSQWVQQISPTPASHYNILFLNSQTGYISSVSGIILKTTDGGTNWDMPTPITYLNVFDIYFIDINTGVAVCSNTSTFNSSIYKTTNGGTNWVLKFSGSRIALRGALQFINSDTGYAGGWSIDTALVKTTDGGESWQRVYVSGAIGIDKICFIDANTGYMAGYGMDSKPSVLKTTNGGLNWTKIYSHSNAMMFMSMYFVNAYTGWVVGTSASNQSLIQKTTNAGVNWVDQMNQHPANWELYNIEMINENTGWIVGDAGQIIKTTNGGTNWRAQVDPSPGPYQPLYAVDFNNADTGWIVGGNGRIYKTTNGGGTVSVQNISTEIPSAYSLKQNYPNPFNPRTVISFQLPAVSNVMLKVYDVTGKEVATLVNERLQAGTYETTFNGSILNSGVYFYRLTTDGFSETKRMMMIK